MKQNIQVKLFLIKESSSVSTENSYVISNYVTNLEIPLDSTISNVKNICKLNIPNLEVFDIVGEKIWIGNKETKDEDVFEFKSGYEYNLFVKKKS